jgi:hypothetical protein
VKARLKKGLEVLGVVAPIVCLIHCLATPILLTALPFVTACCGDHGTMDAWIHWGVIGLCAVAILPAYAAHRKWNVLALFLAGAGFVLIPEYVGIAETLASTVILAICASVCLVSANLLNRKYSRALSPDGAAVACCSVPHQSQHSEV